MAVLEARKGIERIEDLIERTILIQAAKGVLGHWRLVQAAPQTSASPIGIDESR
jgi:hypothetical protein